MTDTALIETAQTYHRLGIPVVPFKITKKENGEYEKKNIGYWKKWETEPQTDQEFNALNWSEANAFAVILGTQALNGLYLSVVDYDCKGSDVQEEVKTKGLTLLKEFPITCMEQTVNNGIHLVYWTRIKPKTVATYHNTASLELLGEKKLCLMAPSLGYSKLNDNTPTEIENIEQIFLSIMKKHILLKDQTQPTDQTELAQHFTLNKPRPCIIEALKLQLTGPTGHLMRLCCAAEYKRLGYSNQEIIELFKNQADFDFNTCSAQVDSIDPVKTAKCETIKEYGYCLPNCSLKQGVGVSFLTSANLAILAHINEIENPKLTAKPVKIEAVISSTSISHTIPAQIKATLIEENQDPATITPTITIDDPINLSLVAVTQETQNNRLTKFLRQRYPNAKVILKEAIKHRTVYLVRIRPPVFTLKKQGDKIVDEQGYEYKYYDIFVISDKQLTFQASSKIIATGIPLPHPKTQRLTFLAYEIEFPETTNSFDVQALNSLKAKLCGKSVLERWNWILDQTTLATQIVGRQNIAAAAYLTFFSPLRIEFNGKIERGWIITDVIGDTTTGKSETIKQIVANLKAGMFFSAETASIAGLTGAASQLDNGNWFVEAGFLPLMNNKLLALDGCNKISPQQWGTIAEIERLGEVHIGKAAKAVMPARTRQIKIYNAVDTEAHGYPPKELSGFLYPIQAYPTVAHPHIIARRDLVVFADRRDVDIKQINTKPTGQPDPEYYFLSELLRWCWNNKVIVIWGEGVCDFLLEEATKLHHLFGYSAIPIVSDDIKFKLARLSIAAAYLTLSTEDFNSLIVTKEHVCLIRDFLVAEYSRAGLNILAQKNRYEKLTLEDVEDAFRQIEDALGNNPVERCKLIAILEDLVIAGRTTRDQLKVKYGLAEKSQLNPLVSVLQNLGLMRQAKGYYSTQTLIEAYKVSENFAKIAQLAEVKKDTPPPVWATFEDRVEA